MIRALRVGIGAGLALLALGTAARAQQDTTRLPTGVRLGLTYQTLQRAKVAVRPFGSLPGNESVATLAGGILQRDLDYSDRFQMADFVPAALAARGKVDFKAWSGLGVVWLVTGDVVPNGAGNALHVALYDVVYGQVKQAQDFPLPPAQSPDFRMAVHHAADAVVQWITGKPGIAATRVAFVVGSGRSGWALRAVDSDGENVQTLATASGHITSPAWSPDGSRLAFARAAGGGDHWDLVERDMATGATRVLLSRQLIWTPAYAPDGRHMAFAAWNGRGSEVDDYDVVQRCCLRRLTAGTADDLSPSYSPDGSRLAFNSDRLGQPEIYVMPSGGGTADLLSPYTYGEPGYYTSPAWAPSGSQVAFHGRSRGEFQIMLADASRPGAPVQQITADGRNEDPSWAPDARHIVFSGVRAGGSGLYVVDVATGRVRPLLVGGRYRVPDWSPALRGGSKGATQR